MYKKVKLRCENRSKVKFSLRCIGGGLECGDTLEYVI